MKNKLLLSLLILSPLMAFAQDSPFNPEQKGIKIVPMSQLGVPAEFKAKTLANFTEQKKNGFIQNSDNRANYLLTIPSNAANQIMGQKNKKPDPRDTHIKLSLSEVKLNFPFSPIKGVKESDVIGYAAIGSYKENGWDGIMEIFHTDFGNCSYSRTHIVAVQLAKETTEYFVNKKPSNKIITGDYNSGFLYTINWYTDTSMNILECANKSFNTNILTKMVVLANKIDK